MDANKGGDLKELKHSNEDGDGNIQIHADYLHLCM